MREADWSLTLYIIFIGLYRLTKTKHLNYLQENFGVKSGGPYGK